MHLHHFVQRYSPARGGAEAYFERLANFHKSHGDHVTTWTTNAIDLEAFWQKGHRETSTATPDVRRYQPWRFPLRRYLLKAASFVPIRPWQAISMPCNPLCPKMWWEAGRYKGPIDAVHATAFPYAFPILCGLRLARRRKVPFYVTPFLHLGDPTNPRDHTRKQYTSPALQWLMKQADGIFVQTKWEHDVVQAMGVPANRIHHQGLGVNPSECTGGDRNACRRRWGTSENEVVIGHLANASVEKGTVDLLKACEQLWQQGLKFRVVLAGPEMANFRNYWHTFPWQQNVTRLGVIPDAFKPDYCAGIDLFALPSRSDSFGLVLLEAWANAKPVVVYKAGGPGELVQHNRDGLIAPCGDVQGLANQLQSLIEQPQLRNALGEVGQRRTQIEFVWKDKLELVRDTISQRLTRVVTMTIKNTTPARVRF